MKALARIIRAYAHEIGRRVKLIVDPSLRVPASDLERLVSEIERALERGARPRVFVRLKREAPCGLATCDLCGAHVAARGAVHFAALDAIRPCPRSWPPTTARSST